MRRVSSSFSSVARAVSEVLARLGGRVTRAALVIPDTAAKVSLIRFDTVPSITADLAQLVRWQVRKSAPFPLDQAVITFTPGIKPADGGQEFIVTTARVDVIDQYERACAQAGVYAGLIDIATFSVLNGVLNLLPEEICRWNANEIALVEFGPLIFWEAQ